MILTSVQPYDDVSDTALLQMSSETPPGNQVAVAWLHSKLPVLLRHIRLVTLLSDTATAVTVRYRGRIGI